MFRGEIFIATAKIIQAIFKRELPCIRRDTEVPYKSAKQRAYMHIHLPSIAKRWDAKYGGKVAPKGPPTPPKKRTK